MSFEILLAIFGFLMLICLFANKICHFFLGMTNLQTSWNSVILTLVQGVS